LQKGYRRRHFEIIASGALQAWAAMSSRIGELDSRLAKEVMAIPGIKGVRSA